MEILRFATAGSVDDGKSTLIGRLLYDTKSLFEDQVEAVEHASIRQGEETMNLALFTDGLRAEREQGITIDVAYRYFATPKRKFIIADTPGHTQYTRNMVTGASTADLALVLVDVRNGVVEQSRRHSFLSSLLRVPHLTLCVNKMDLVDYSQDAFEEVKADFQDFAARLNITDMVVIPVSALNGDNVVTRSPEMSWYDGPSLLHHLDEVYIASDRNLVDSRFAVQYVLRPRDDKHHDYRGYAGTVLGGVLKVGDEITVLPSGFSSRIISIEGPQGPIGEAFAPMSVTITLDEDLDISRGDMFCKPNNQPAVAQDVDVMLCWMSETTDLPAGSTWNLKHSTRWAKAKVSEVMYGLDINTLRKNEEVKSLKLNDIGRVKLRTTIPIFADSYSKNRSTGSFILSDPASNNTVGAGIILDKG